MDGRYLMAVDAGTGSVRAVIFDTDGRQVGQGQHEWFHKEDPRYPGSMDFDWVFNWQLACKCMKEAVQSAGIKPEEISAVSTTCMREGIVLYDHDLREIWACANVDARADDEVASLVRSDPDLELRLYHQSGQTFALDALPRLLWVKNKLPQLYERTRCVGMFNDWLIFKLTGCLEVDPSNGSTSGLMDLKRRAFAPEICKACGLRTDIFPPTRECGTQIGTISAAGAADSGLAVGTPVVVGGGDAQLGTLGVGAVSRGQAAFFGGSFWQYEYNTDRPLTDAHGRVRVNCHSVPGMWQFEALAFKPGLAMRWYRDAFCESECAAARARGCDPYDLMNEKAAAVPAGSFGMMCAFSDVMNFTCWKHAAPTFANFDFDPGKFNRYTFYRALLENTALVARGHVELVRESTGAAPEYAVFGGGAAKSALWSQILADVTGLEIRVPVVKEATALGAAMLAGCGVGIYPDLPTAARRMTRIERVFRPNPADHAVYDRLYENWRKFYRAQLELADAGLTRHMWAAPGL